MWFNPPFSLNVITKIFLKLVKRRFPKENPLHKIFNKNTLKVSYSSMGNVASALSSQNKNILYPKKSEFGCNCTSKTDFPLDSKCLTPNIVYQADIRNDSNDEKKFYLGVSETPFKEGFRNHKKEFTHKKYWNSTELSKYTWQLNDANITPIVTWKVVAKVFSETKFNFCKLCLREKVFIIKALNDSQLLNKKSDLTNTCHHQSKLLLKCLNRNNRRHDSID